MNFDFKEKLKAFYTDIIEANDLSHRMDHMDSVYENAVHINQVLGLNVPETHIAIMAYCHDLFTLYRDNHHLLGKEHLLTTNEWFMKGINDGDRKLIACAVGEHRASFDGEYTSIYSQLLASADRGKPLAVHDMLIRSFNYARSKLKKEYGESVVHAISHVKEKFGSSGYTRYPKIYLLMYAQELKKRSVIIDKLIVPSSEFLDLKCPPPDFKPEKIFDYAVENAKKALI